MDGSKQPTKWNTFRQTAIEIVSVSAAGGLMIALTPAQIRTQVTYGAIAAVAPIMVISAGWRYNAQLTEELQRQSKEHAKRQAELDRLAMAYQKTREQLDKRVAEAELAEAQLRSQAEALQKMRIDNEFQLREQTAQMDLELQQGAIKLEKMRAAIDAERADLRMSIRMWEEVGREQQKLQLRTELEAERQEMLAQWEKTKSDLQEAELVRIRALEQEYLAKAIELEHSRSDWEIERSKSQEEHEKSLAAEHSQMQQLMMAELERLKEAVYQDVSEQFGQQQAMWLAEIDNLNQIIKQLRTQELLLREQIAKQRQPKRPKGTSVPQAIAAVVHEWLLNHKVMCDFESIQYVESDEMWCMVIAPWWEQGVQLKDFKKLEGISRSSLQMVEQIKFEDSLDGMKAWFKLSPSAHLVYATPRQKILQRADKLARGATEKGMEMDYGDRGLDLDDDIHTPASVMETPEVRFQVARLERKNEFMLFVGTALTQGYFPLYGEVSELEKKTILFWMQYQSVCYARTDLNDEQTILKVYGVARSGVRSRSSDYDVALQRLAGIKRELHIGEDNK